MSGKTNLRKTVAVVGMMGAGKTSIGRRLSTRLDAPFADADHEMNDERVRRVEREGEFLPKGSQSETPQAEPD